MNIVTTIHDNFRYTVIALDIIIIEASYTYTVYVLLRSLNKFKDKTFEREIQSIRT